MNFLRPRRLATGALSLLLVTTAATVARAQGTLAGTVTVQGTGTPLQEARIIVLNTSLFTTSGPDGKYTIRGIPAGPIDVRVIRVGYLEQKKSVAISNGQTAALDFTMAQAVVQLAEVVTTATGEQRRVEVGNAVENVSVSKLTESAPIRSVAAEGPFTTSMFSMSSGLMSPRREKFEPPLPNAAELLFDDRRIPSMM